MTNTVSTSRSQTTHKIVVTAMLIAVSYIAALLSQLIPPVAGFLSYDPKDAVVAIGGFLYGPMTAVVISVITSLIEMVTLSTTGVYGLIMNVISTCAFVVPAALLYKKLHNMKGAIGGLVLGMVAMTVSMLLWNYIITPMYMGVDRSVVVGMLPTVFLPFNLIKSGINTGLTMVLYKPLVTALRRANLVPAHEGKSGGSYHAGFAVLSLVVLATFVLLFLAFTGVL